MSAPPLTFHRFGDLPPELRHQIWLDSLPAIPDTLLLRHRSGTWQPADVATKARQGIEADKHLVQYQTDRLGGLTFVASQLHVNYESRRITRDWIQQHCLEPRISKEGKIIRRFRQASDILFLSLKDEEEFHNEYYSVTTGVPYPHGSPAYESEHSMSDEGQYSIEHPRVSRIALCDASFHEDPRRAGEWCNSYEVYVPISHLYIIVDAPAALLDQAGEQGWWTIAPIAHMSTTFDRESKRQLTSLPDRDSLDSASQAHLTLLETLADNLDMEEALDRPFLTIQLAHAIRF